MSRKDEIGIVRATSREVHFEWKINHIFAYTQENVHYFSPKFHLLGSVWQILMRPNGQTGDNSTGHLSLYLVKKSKSPKTVDFSFSITSKDYVATNKRKTSWKCSENSFLVWGWPKFIERFKLQQEKENLVPFGCLTILCALIIKDEEKDFDARHIKLAEDLAELCISQKDSDVTFEINDERISAHKSILTTRSPVFAAMFENDMIEKKTGVVLIPDCDKKAFNVFLLYLYSGKVEFEKCDVFDLYKISDKYIVPELKLMCVEFMINSLSVENVYETFARSREIHERKVLCFTQQFFYENYEKIISLDTWKSFLRQHTHMANDLIKGMIQIAKLSR